MSGESKCGVVILITCVSRGVVVQLSQSFAVRLLAPRSSDRAVHATLLRRGSPRRNPVINVAGNNVASEL